MTLLIVDPDAHYPSNLTEKYMLHNMVINNDEIVWRYKSPNLPMDSAPHRYFIQLYKLSNPIKLDKPIAQRLKKSESFVKKYGLKKVDEFVFKCRK